MAEEEFNPEAETDAFADKDKRPDWWPEGYGSWDEALGRWVEPAADDAGTADWETRNEGVDENAPPPAEWVDVVEEFFQPELGADGEPVHEDPDPDSIEDDAERAQAVAAQG